jgi:hypothetical protein
VEAVIMKPVLSAIGIGMVFVGFIGLGRAPWLGWLDIIVGVLALLASTAKVVPKSASYVGLTLGVATLIIWIVALATGTVPWLTWLTFIGGVAFVLSSPLVTRPTLPPRRGPGPHFPP